MNEGIIALVGKANQAHYVRVEEKHWVPRTGHLKAHRILRNMNLSEDKVLSEIKEGSPIFVGLPSNIAGIVDYAFTEMLDDKIEHSQSDKIEVVIERTARDIDFHVSDRGVGIFNNIMEKKHLRNHMEAIQDLLKRKGDNVSRSAQREGIFFTSKVADFFSIRSSEKKLVFDNMQDDLYIRDIKSVEEFTEFLFSSRSILKRNSSISSITTQTNHFNSAKQG